MPSPQFLQRQLVPIPMTGGLNTKVDAFQLQAPNLADLQNAVFTKQGKLSKRRGYNALSTTIEGGGAIQAAAAISSFQDELLLFTGTRVYSFLETTGTWIDRGLAVSVIAGDRTVYRDNATEQLNPDAAYQDGMEVYAWEDESGAVRYSVVDVATGAFAVNNGLLAAACIKPRLTTFFGNVYVFYTDGINNLFYKVIDPHNPTHLSAAVTVAGDMAAWGGFDVTASANRLYLAYLGTPFAGTIKAKSYDASMAQTAANTIASGATATDGSHSAVDAFIDSMGQIWISWATGTDVQTSAFGFDLAPILTARQVVAATLCPVLSGVESSTQGVMLLAIEVHAASPGNEFVEFRTVTTAGTVATYGTPLRSVGLASRGFIQSGHRYLNVTHESVLQSTYFTVYLDDTACPVVSKSQPSTGGGLRTNGTVSNAMVTTAPTAVLCANGCRGKIISEANTVFSLPGVNGTTLDFSGTEKFLSVAQSRNLFTVGGVLSSYDGASATEHLFHLYPEGVTAVAGGVDGFLSPGSYQYVVTYEWTDNYGQIQRSAPSVPVSVTVAATNHVTVTVPTLRLTQKQGTRAAPSIVIYRTTVNGTIFFRVTDTLAPLLNSTTVDTKTFVDVLSDADIESTELVYTTGGVLANIAPPSHRLVSLFQGRVVLGGLEDPNLLWFSKNKFDNSNANTVPVEFAAELTIGTDARGGPITALGLLDDKLIIFKKSSIFYVSGDGPTDTGGGTPFGDPILVTTDVGCSNPNSVVVTPNGVMFMSSKGLYLLDRTVSVSYLGAPVEDFNDQTITSATLSQDTNQVIFTCAQDRALVYDYYFGQWGTWTNHLAADSDVFEGAFTFVRPNGVVYQQSADRFDDGGKFVSLSFTTPWFQLAGMAGYQRLYRFFLLGEYKSAHKLNFEVAYDFSPAFTQSVLVDATQGVSTWGGDPTWGALGTVWGGTFLPYMYRVDTKTQKCTSARIRVSDSQQRPFSEGYSISGLTLEVGVIAGGNRLAQSRIVGAK